MGRGFFASTPLVEETEAAGLSRLIDPYTARGRTRHQRIGRRHADRGSRLESPATLFTSRVSDPWWSTAPTVSSCGNIDEPTTNLGAEILGTFRRAPFALTTTYTYVRAR